MPAYLNSLDNLILRTNLPADKDPRQYGKRCYPTLKNNTNDAGSFAEDASHKQNSFTDHMFD